MFERISEGKLSVCKVTFGAEPKDYEIYEFVLKNYDGLRFSPAVAAVVKEAGRNPKRVQREVRKQVQNTGIGTKSQQALKLQQEQLKQNRGHKNVLYIGYRNSGRRKEYNGRIFGGAFWHSCHFQGQN